MPKKVSGDIGPIIDIALIAGLAFAAYKIYSLFGGGGDSNVPKGPSPFDPTKQIPITTQPNGNTPSIAKETALQWVDNYLLTRGVNDPFSPGLYNTNPDASTIDYNTLVSLAGQINDMKPGFWGQLMKNGLDGNALYQLIQQNCRNQIDVSNLAIVFQQLYGQDLLTWLWTPDTMANGYVSFGFSDIEWMQKIIQYALSLPAQ